MSANDKAAATYGRQPMTTTEQVAAILDDHQLRSDYSFTGEVVSTCQANGCNWTHGSFGDEMQVVASQHAAQHHSEVLAPFIAYREHEASRPSATNWTPSPLVGRHSPRVNKLGRDSTND